jgi:queuine/archaeosine tRNA-ribosyltransferase
MRHLSKLEDGLFHRLATIHNLTFMTRLTDVLSQRLAGRGPPADRHAPAPPFA